MSGVEWWVPGALALIVAVGAGALAVLVVLAIRGTWRLFHPGGAHHGGQVERWVPWEDGRGSMILAEEREVWADRNAGRFDSAPGQPGSSYPLSGGPGWPAPVLDWREVAHEEDWRDQTAHDLAPATLDSGLAVGPSLAPASPDPLDLGGEGHARDFFPPELDSEQGCIRCQNLDGTITESCYCREEYPEPEPEVRTVAGRLVETSGEWLRRLERDAGPGWTYAGTVAA